MRFTEATLLNTVVCVQRFVDITDERLDRSDQADDRQLLDDVLEHLSADALEQTSAKHAGAADTTKGCLVRNARRLIHTRCIAATAAAWLRNVRVFAVSMVPPAGTGAHAVSDWVGSTVTAAGANAAAFVSVRRSFDFLAPCTAPSVASTATSVNRADTCAAQRAAAARLNAERSRGPSAVKVLASLVEPSGDASPLCRRCVRRDGVIVATIG